MDFEPKIEDPREPRKVDRRRSDVNKKLAVAGVSGAAILGFLMTVFSFMNAAPWATKVELANLKENVDRIERKQDNMATKQDMAILVEMIRELKQDVKEMKTEGRIK